MEAGHLAWIAVGLVGVLLGAFLRPAVVVWVVFALVVAVCGGVVGAVSLGAIRPEWLYLLMAVLPAGAVIFVAAILSNALVDSLRRQFRGKGAADDAD